jgi:signal transduction histidine kinase/ActR/RegA family two-component response regulator
MTEAPDIGERVLILAPAGRDAQLAAAMLHDAEIASTICDDMETFCAEQARGAAAGLLTQEALAGEAHTRLAAALGAQPLWSDFPLVVLASRPTTEDGGVRLGQIVGALGNVTLLDRPLHPEALLSTVRAALRARGRQHQARELLARLEQGVRERDQFLATLSHELRNPLGAIRNALRLLERVMPPAPAAERPLAIVDRQVGHLAQLIDDLLDVSRVTTGKVVLQRRPLDLRAVLQQTLLQLEPELDRQQLKLVTALGAGPLTIDADPVRLEQIFTNLLANAIKYTPAGGRVEVSAGTEGGQAWVRIVDTGVGIAPEMLSGIFDLFSQVDRSLDRAQGGMGIGLTLVRSLLELHGGSVSAASAGLGAGSTFTVRLPLAKDAQAPAAAPERASTIAPGPRPHVLLVEDSEDNREMLQDLLEMDGFLVDVAATGPEAVSQALSRRPQIAIVDIGLPLMDGFEVARRVRAELGRSISLVALTGYGQAEDRQRTAAAGFDAHLTKPIDLAELEAVLRQMRVSA